MEEDRFDIPMPGYDGHPGDEHAGPNVTDGAVGDPSACDAADEQSEADVMSDEESMTEEVMTEEDVASRIERRQRSIGIVAIVGTVTILGMVVLINSFPSAPGLRAGSRPIDSVEDRGPRIYPTDLVLSRMRVVDTIYTTDSLYLDLNLGRQTVTVHFRNGSERTFLVSSGNPAIPEAISTPAGMFTIQNMQPMAISKQFHDARLHHWIGIHAGVGFHGLDGSGYYWNLGKRPSSHGCVRMSREQVAEMYKLVHPGALIMSHYGPPARVVAFCAMKDTAGAEVIDSVAVYSKTLGHERMRALYDGKFWVEEHPRLVHLANQRVRWGLEIGDARRVPKQDVPRFSYISRFGHVVPIVPRPDQSAVPEFRAGDYAAFVHVGDSLRTLRQKELKEEEKTVQYGD